MANFPLSNILKSRIKGLGGLVQDQNPTEILQEPLTVPAKNSETQEPEQEKPKTKLQAAAEAAKGKIQKAAQAVGEKVKDTAQTVREDLITTEAKLAIARMQFETKATTKTKQVKAEVQKRLENITNKTTTPSPTAPQEDPEIKKADDLVDKITGPKAGALKPSDVESLIKASNGKLKKLSDSLSALKPEELVSILHNKEFLEKLNTTTTDLQEKLYRAINGKDEYVEKLLDPANQNALDNIKAIFPKSEIPKDLIKRKNQQICNDFFKEEDPAIQKDKSQKITPEMLTDFMDSARSGITPSKKVKAFRCLVENSDPKELGAKLKPLGDYIANELPNRDAENYLSSVVRANIATNGLYQKAQDKMFQEVVDKVILYSKELSKTQSGLYGNEEDKLATQKRNQDEVNKYTEIYKTNIKLLTNNHPKAEEHLDKLTTHVMNSIQPKTPIMVITDKIRKILGKETSAEKVVTYGTHLLNHANVGNDQRSAWVQKQKDRSI